METHEIIGYLVIGLTALIGLYVQVTKPIINAIKAITALGTSVDNLTSKFAAFETKSHNTHKSLWEKTNEHDIQLQDHETRIKTMEDGRK